MKIQMSPRRVESLWGWVAEQPLTIAGRAFMLTWRAKPGCGPVLVLVAERGAEGALSVAVGDTLTLERLGSSRLAPVKFVVTPAESGHPRIPDLVLAHEKKFC